MAVSDGQRVNASVTNNAFLSRLVDTSTVGKLALENTETESGDNVDNTQRAINETFDAVGMTGEGDASRKNYSSNNYISDGTSHKTAIGVLDSSLKSVEDATGIAYRFIRFDSDSAYEAVYTPSGGETYYNTTLDKIRTYVDGEGWQNMGAEFVGKQEVPTGSINGTNKDFTISLTPLSADTIQVFVDGLIIDIDDWSYSSGVITLDTAPLYGQDVYVWYITEGTPASATVVSGTPRVEYVTISAAQASSESVTLGNTPTSANIVMLDVLGGAGAQEFGTDYSVSSNVLYWNGLALDGVLAEGDKLRIQYFS